MAGGQNQAGSQHQQAQGSTMALRTRATAARWGSAAAAPARTSARGGESGTGASQIPALQRAFASAPQSSELAFPGTRSPCLPGLQLRRGAPGSAEHSQQQQAGPASRAYVSLALSPKFCESLSFPACRRGTDSNRCVLGTSSGGTCWPCDSAGRAGSHWEVWAGRGPPSRLSPAAVT